MAMSNSKVLGLPIEKMGCPGNQKSSTPVPIPPHPLQSNSLKLSQCFLQKLIAQLSEENHYKLFGCGLRTVFCMFCSVSGLPPGGPKVM